MIKLKFNKLQARTMMILLLSLMAFSAHSQKLESLSIAVQNESVALPFTRIAPIRPGFEIGVTLRENVKTHSIIRWNAYAGLFFHKDLDRSIYLRGEYQYQFNIRDALGVSVPIGIGYMHSFLNRPIYEQNADGSFSEKKQLGRPHALLNTGLGVSYLKLGAIEPFIKYELLIQTPFATSIPALPRTFLKIGSTIKF